MLLEPRCYFHARFHADRDGDSIWTAKEPLIRTSHEEVVL